MPVKTLKQFVTYNLVGIVNTLFGFSIIFVLMFAGVGATSSNAVGYALGALLSYILNKKYTFGGVKHSTLLAVKFFSVLFIAYLLNLFTLQWLLGMMNPYLAQIGAGAVYTLSSFLLAKFMVFKV
ncbi:GtrA family protein [Sulfurovum sp.]|uniref:GtrA family protein n=1 Tax=Sulfurovum sp. TaxID=1969726 RepID=UPI0025D23FC4|nr:GtrA family protein [Sulfurovum sp.]